MFKTLFSAFALLFAVGVSGCNFSGSRSDRGNTKEFEGVITYKTKRWSLRDSDATKAYTDTVRIYYSHGNMVKLHSGNSSNSANKELFLTKSHQYYFTRLHIDTLFWYDITRNPGIELANMRSGSYPKQILGHTCEYLTLYLKNQHNGTIFKTEYQYVFSRGYLSVNKNFLGQYKFGYFDNFIDESGCFYLGYKYALYTESGVMIVSTEFEAISVKEKKLDPKIFEPDKLPLKELKL